MAEYSVLGRKKGGGHLDIIAKFPTNKAAADFSLTVDMKPYEDVWVEIVEEKALPTPATLTERSSAGLRDALFDEIDAFRKGKGDPQRAVAISKLASQILVSARIEHEIAKYKGSDGYASEPLQLGSKPKTN